MAVSFTEPARLPQPCRDRINEEEMMPRKSLHNKELSAAQAESASLNNTHFPCGPALPKYSSV